MSTSSTEGDHKELAQTYQGRLAREPDGPVFAVPKGGLRGGGPWRHGLALLCNRIVTLALRTGTMCVPT